MALTKVKAGSVDFNRTNSENGLRMPSGGAFSGTAVEGMIRNDTTQSSEGSASTMQHYNATNWKNFVNANRPVDIEYLLIAGGGGGGYQDGGGGGAGGFLTSTVTSITKGTNIVCTVGAGAAGGTKTPAAVNSGSNSVLQYSSRFTQNNITAIGGGGGSSDNNGDGGAADGGSGGGGASGSGTTAGGSGTVGQGNDGGDGNNNNQGGGGGGAGAVGEDANSSGANGGIGLTTTIISTTDATSSSVGEVSGSNVYFSGGGGGDNRTVFGSGGLGGGTNAAASPIDASSNTGGGGGSAFNGSPVRGANGGSGVVIIKILASDYSGTTTGSPDVYDDGSYKILVFKSSGTLQA